MRKEEIDILLKKYYEGVSTDQEEYKLREFFTGNNVPTGYESEKALFDYFSLSSLPNEGFEERIIASLDRALEQEPVRWRIVAGRIAGIAASVLILAASLLFFSRDKQADTFSDPEIAYSETMKILYDVSVMMNSGAATLQPVSKINLRNSDGLEVLAKSKETLNRNLMNLNKPGDNTNNKDTSGK